jgi:antitoxin ParD1/3/4
MPTSVALSTHFESFIRAQIDSGRYNNVSEVIRAGLRLLEDQQQAAAQLEELRAAIKAGLESGTPRLAETVFDRLEARYRAGEAV